jgi:hypothetical protein
MSIFSSIVIRLIRVSTRLSISAEVEPTFKFDWAKEGAMIEIAKIITANR